MGLQKVSLSSFPQPRVHFTVFEHVFIAQKRFFSPEMLQWVAKRILLGYISRKYSLYNTAATNMTIPINRSNFP